MYKVPSKEAFSVNGTALRMGEKINLIYRRETHSGTKLIEGKKVFCQHELM